MNQCEKTGMSKVILISTRKAPDWKAWTDLKSRKKTEKARITMTQTEAQSILRRIIEAESQEDACNFSETRMPSRKHLSFWLGQIAHRQDVRFGSGRDFRGYITAVVERLRSRTQDNMTFLQDEEGKEMKTKDGRPVVVIRKGKSPNKANETTETVKETAVRTTEGETALADVAPKEKPAMSRLQDNFLRNLLVFADCAVQKDESGVFDTLARNFGDKAMLNYWLSKTGYGHLSEYTQNKDIVDFIRKVAYELHRDLKKTVGQPVARW